MKTLAKRIEAECPGYTETVFVIAGIASGR